MVDRRQFLSFATITLLFAPLAAWLSRFGAPSVSASDQRFPVVKTDEEWRAALTPEQYAVLRRGRTEWAYSSPLDNEKRRGTFVCAACGHPLFSSTTKYDSGTGWPSFWAPLENAVGTAVDRTFFFIRTEVHCARCGGHLGHVFPDGPKPTGQRYCMNGVAMRFVPDREAR